MKRLNPVPARSTQYTALANAKVTAEFPKSCRVLKRQDYLQIQSSIKKYQSTHFMIFYCKKEKLWRMNRPRRKPGEETAQRTDKPVDATIGDAMTGDAVQRADTPVDATIGETAPRTDRQFDRTPVDPRIGITVTKKVHKHAVQRNKIKRLVREVFRKNKHRLDKRFDFVIIAKSNAEKLDYRHVEAELLYVWKKTLLLRS